MMGDPPFEWKMPRLYDDGEGSFWGEASFPLRPSGKIGALSDLIKSDGAILRWTPGSYDWKWHNAPQRQIIVCLNSQTEVTTTGGDKRVFGPGDCFLVEDTAGKGHCSKCLNGEDRQSIFITLPPSNPEPPALKKMLRLVNQPVSWFAVGLLSGWLLTSVTAMAQT